MGGWPKYFMGSMVYNEFMIDWYGLFANSLWILGLSIALATLSYASWQASVLRERTVNLLKTSGSLTSFSIAGTLFCAGLATTSDAVIETVIWTILAFLFLIQLVLNARQVNPPKKNL